MNADSKNKTWKLMKSQYQLMLMSIPFVCLLILFSYGPLWGWIVAFQKYLPGKGIFGSDFVGWSNFERLFGDERFFLTLRNTLAMSLMGLVSGFFGAIGLALLLNEVRVRWFKRTIQTVTYIPHFVSMVVIANIILTFLSPDGGAVNDLLMWLGLIDRPIYFMGEGRLYWIINTLTGLWKELGWSTIIYLAVLTGLNQETYEAAEVDGAGRFRKMISISLPGIMPTALMLLMLNLGSLINTGYELQMLLGNPLIMDYSEVLDLYALNRTLGAGQYGVGVALSIFKSFISLVLIFTANSLAKKFGQARLF